MKSSNLRDLYLSFFNRRGHEIIPSFSLVPENDPSTLFISSGMQPLVPYLLGESHPLGNKLVNSQKCFRAEDIEEVGDNRHTTFFEMLGNWSLGDYFKDKQLPWFFEFLVSEVGLDPKKLYVTVFKGNKDINIPKDNESVKLWQELFSQKNIDNKVVDEAETKGMQDGRIFYYDESYGNWWSRSGRPQDMPAGEPGGPCSEVFYDFGPELKMHEKSVWAKKPCHPNCDCGRYLEIGNSVFMEYKKEENGEFSKLPQKNVDFGGGLERILAAKLNTPDVFKTDLFWPIIKEVEEYCGKSYQENKPAMRVIADHIKAAVFMISEGIEPSNKLQGYILRRLLRRAAVKMHQLKGGLTPGFDSVAHAILNVCGNTTYFQDGVNLRGKISKILGLEMDKFAKSLDRGLKEFNKLDDNQLNSLWAFTLFQTYGFPFEVTAELFAQKGKKLDKKEFDDIFAKHKELSRTASKGMFKGGLADKGEEITKLHTVTHLLHASLRKVLGKHVEQVGSNITSERLRFDFTHPNKLSEDEIKKIENMVNEQIAKNLKIESETMGLAEAKKSGALAFFGQKYPAKVKVYNIGSFSKELCGGPHVDFTGGLGKFIIKKEQAVGFGKRRVYAVLKEK